MLVRLFAMEVLLKHYQRIDNYLQLNCRIVYPEDAIKRSLPVVLSLAIRHGMTQIVIILSEKSHF